MGSLHQFTYGLTTPVLAFALSFLGSLLGLVAAGRARGAATPAARARWLGVAAWAIGGTGIWVMHFMAMMGFTVNGSAIRYDVEMTVASFLISVIVVAVGLFTVGYGRPTTGKLLVGGPLAGLGVAAMHYTGMDGMRMQGTISYNPVLVLLSVVIAVVAATAALWFSLVVRRPLVLVASAAIMGVAVCGMHYTGMYAMRVQMHDMPGEMEGMDPLAFLVPILVFVVLVAVGLAYALLAAPSQRDAEATPDLHARLAEPAVPAVPAAIPATSSFIPLRERLPRP